MSQALPEKHLIFLLSQPRAGSTMLQRILAAHPAVHTTAEPWLMLPLAYALRERGHQARYGADLAARAISTFTDSLPAGKEDYWAAVAEMALTLYGKAVTGAGKERFLDKTPRYYLIIPELARAFPQAQFILLWRNPLAVLASVLSTRVKEHWPLLAGYHDDLVVAPRLLQAATETLEGRLTVCHYETLVSTPEAAVSELCAELGLSYQPEMINYGKQAAPAGKMGDETGIDRHTRPSTASLDRWRGLGKNRQTRHLASAYLNALGMELIGQMGYDASQLLSELEKTELEGGEIKYRWQTLMKPDSAFEKRLLYVELARLEHSRLVRWARERWPFS